MKRRARYIRARLRRFVLLNILHVNDTPNRIAWGAAVGMFVALTPTFGVQIFLVLALTWILRVNKVAGFAMVWVTNAVTIAPIYTLQYILGAFLMGEGFQLRLISYPGKESPGFWQMITSPWQTIQATWTSIEEIAIPLCVGSLASATIWGLLTYFVVRMAVTQRRLRRAGIDVKGISAHPKPDLHSTRQIACEGDVADHDHTPAQDQPDEHQGAA
ncbi:MAG: hypothetical protein CMJ49_11270 [Planctomycetaceae bacterium]|nr:hypothetical protein [Planctomycetaceae bacterium]